MRGNAVSWRANSLRGDGYIVWNCRLHPQELVSRSGADRCGVATIIHRGPDQQGVFQVQSSVSLGVTRLKIIDLSSGDQPISAENGDAVIVFNGEIYNYGSYAPNSSAAVTNFALVQTPRPSCEAFLNGIPHASRVCAECSPSRCGANRRGDWCWHAIAWGSNRSISLDTAKMCCSAPN